MITTHHITVDLNNRGNRPQIHAVQGDLYTHAVKITLLSNGSPFDLPADAAALVRFRKPDGTGGVYSTMPDDSAAYSIGTDTVTIRLAPQLLTCPGATAVSVALSSENQILGICSFLILVEQDPSLGTVESRDYFNYETLAEINSTFIRLEAAIEALKESDNSIDQQIDAVRNLIGAPTDQQVADWLNAHPEATTTVLNGAVTPEKTSFISYDREDRTEDVANFTNQIPISTASDGSVFNSVGYQTGYRINSTGTETAADGIVLTGFIPAAEGDTLRTSVIFGGDASYESVSFWDSGKAFLQTLPRSSLTNYGVSFTDDALEWTIDSSVFPTAVAANIASACYIRIAAENIDASAIVTINEELTYSQVTHPGVAVNFRLSEDIAVPLAEENALRLDAIEAGAAGAPNYVQTAARAVAKTVQTLQGGRTFCFGAIADTHASYSAATDTAILHAGQALNLIRRSVPLDLVAHFGDYTKAGASSTLEESEAAFRYVNTGMADAFSGVPNIRMNGNHDCNVYNYDGVFSADQLFARIGKYAATAHTDPDNRARNYGYLDFDSLQLRVIYLNTSDVGDIAPKADDAEFGGHRCSPAQLTWLVNALDLTQKNNPSQWQILLLSHSPLDWAAYNYADANGTLWAMNVRNVLSILDAYNNGAAGSITMENCTISFDFSEKNAPTLIGTIHGHTHNFNSARIGSTGILRLAIPNACSGRENTYAGTASNSRYGDEVSYPKAAGTAEDTSFNIVTIDLKGRKIYCTNYGAGIDREYSY